MYVSSLEPVRAGVDADGSDRRDNVTACRVSSVPPASDMPLVDPLRSFDGIVRKISVAGASTGPLAGTTFVAKDLYDVQGIPRARAIQTGSEPTESPGR